MDFVYICRSGKNEELRYSIRSVVKNFKDPSIWIVGGKPDWYSGNFIPLDDYGNKFININNCYKAIVKGKNISSDFILMNDDFFILSNKINSFNYYDGLLKDKIFKHMCISGNSSYARALKGAVEELKKLGIEQPKNYDIHVPMTLNKAKLEQVLDLSLAPRSMYGNMFIENGINIKDVKIYAGEIYDKTNFNFTSTVGRSFLTIKPMLEDLFLKPSQYEINP